MSLSKELCLRSDSQNRQSFSERICDDLSEVILQYLSLEDKFRLEGVSKQFQRTVFQRQYELYNYYIENEGLDLFEALLKKCPNITSIELDRHDPDILNQVFALIIENCNNLSEVIVLTDIILNDSNLEKFHQKFGTTIKCLQFDRELIDLNLFPNIEKLIITDFYLDLSTINELKLAKLKQLEIFVDKGQELVLHKVIDNFRTLKHLSLTFCSDDEKAIYKSLMSISSLKHLIQFRLKPFFVYNKQFCDLFKQMEKNCKNLKSIDCNFEINDQNLEIRQLLSYLKAFPALKRLELAFYLINNEEEEEDNEVEE